MLFFFNDTATTEIYTLALHDALPISDVRLAVVVGSEAGPDHGGLDRPRAERVGPDPLVGVGDGERLGQAHHAVLRSEEHTSELQSRQYLVCRLLLEKKNDSCLLSHV